MTQHLFMSITRHMWNIFHSFDIKAAPTYKHNKNFTKTMYLHFCRFKGHDMLAPFTAGWQSTDVDPLIIEKSEVRFMSTFAV